MLDLAGFDPVSDFVVQTLSGTDDGDAGICIEQAKDSACGDLWYDLVSDARCQTLVWGLLSHQGDQSGSVHEKSLGSD